MSVSLLVGNATLSQESLIDFPHELDNFQIHAINAIEKNEDLLVSVPTGRGKTLVAEYEIVYTIKKMKKKARENFSFLFIQIVIFFAFHKTP